MSYIHSTREDWLQAAAETLRPLIAEKAGLTVPEVHVSCGFPHKGALPGKTQRLGECWHKEASDDNVAHIFITPLLATAEAVYHVLAHELLHAALPATVGHKKPFAKAAMAIGLEGKPTSTVAGEAFKQFEALELPLLGAYPQPHLSVMTKDKKQTTRMIKCECGECGYVARTTAKWLDEYGPPICPNDKIPMDGTMIEDHIGSPNEQKLIADRWAAEDVNEALDYLDARTEATPIYWYSPQAAVMLSGAKMDALKEPTSPHDYIEPEPTLQAVQVPWQWQFLGVRGENVYGRGTWQSDSGMYGSPHDYSDNYN